MTDLFFTPSILIPKCSLFPLHLHTRNYRNGFKPEVTRLGKMKSHIKSQPQIKTKTSYKARFPTNQSLLSQYLIFNRVSLMDFPIFFADWTGAGARIRLLSCWWNNLKLKKHSIHFLVHPSNRPFVWLDYTLSSASKVHCVKKSIMVPQFPPISLIIKVSESSVKSSKWWKIEGVNGITFYTHSFKPQSRRLSFRMGQTRAEKARTRH